MPNITSNKYVRNGYRILFTVNSGNINQGGQITEVFFNTKTVQHRYENPSLAGVRTGNIEDIFIMKEGIISPTISLGGENGGITYDIVTSPLIYDTTKNVESAIIMYFISYSFGRNTLGWTSSTEMVLSPGHPTSQLVQSSHLSELYLDKTYVNSDNSSLEINFNLLYSWAVRLDKKLFPTPIGTVPVPTHGTINVNSPLSNTFYGFPDFITLNNVSSPDLLITITANLQGEGTFYHKEYDTDIFRTVR